MRGVTLMALSNKFGALVLTTGNKSEILQAYVVEHLSKEEILQRGFAAAVANDVINKVTFREYKRRQAAPGLKVSPRACGIGRRIPIAQRFRPAR